MIKPFTTLHSQVLVDKPYCYVEQQRIMLENGNEMDWFVHGKKNAASSVIVARDKEKGILFQKTYKHGCQNIIHEFPTGMVDTHTGETPLEGAKRELLEETGYTASEWHCLGSCFSNPTSSPTVHWYFFANNITFLRPPDLDSSEQIESFFIPEKDFISTIQDKKLAASVWAGWGMYQTNKHNIF